MKMKASISDSLMSHINQKEELFNVKSDLSDINLTLQRSNYNVNTVGRIASTLVIQSRFDMLQAFISPFGEEKTEELRHRNEDFLRSLIALNHEMGDSKNVKRLLETGHFSTYAGLVDVWDAAHYRETEIVRGKGTLTPLTRFRIRNRNPPPKSICPSGKRPSTKLSEESRQIMKDWFRKHSKYPYPSSPERERIARKTNLTPYQVKTWFANTRRRYKLAAQRHEARLSRGKTTSNAVKNFQSETYVQSQETSEAQNWNISTPNTVNKVQPWTGYHGSSVSPSPYNSLQELSKMCGHVQHQGYSMSNGAYQQYPQSYSQMQNRLDNRVWTNSMNVTSPSQAMDSRFNRNVELWNQHSTSLSPTLESHTHGVSQLQNRLWSSPHGMKTTSPFCSPTCSDFRCESVTSVNQQSYGDSIPMYDSQAYFYGNQGAQSPSLPQGQDSSCNTPFSNYLLGSLDKGTIESWMTSQTFLQPYIASSFSIFDSPSYQKSVAERDSEAAMVLLDLSSQ